MTGTKRPKWNWLGAGLLTAGLLLVIASAAAWVDFAASDGDVEGAESSLREPRPWVSAVPGATGREPEPAAGEVVASLPLWQPNPTSLLTDSNRADRAPDPVRLRIARISVDAPVQPYGVNAKTGQMEVPENGSEVGWYQYGPRPGQPGSAVLAAHVDLAGVGRGVFFDLVSLVPGDRIQIVRDDGTQLDFEVMARTTYLKDELPLDVIFSRAGSPTLTLITCGGGFSATTSSYDSNVVVYARPVPDSLRRWAQEMGMPS